MVEGTKCRLDLFFKTLKGSLNIRDAGHMLSGLDRILSVKPIFDIGE